MPKAPRKAKASPQRKTVAQSKASAHSVVGSNSEALRAFRSTHASTSLASDTYYHHLRRAKAHVASAVASTSPNTSPRTSKRKPAFPCRALSRNSADTEPGLVLNIDWAGVVQVRPIGPLLVAAYGRRKSGSDSGRSSVSSPRSALVSPVVRKKDPKAGLPKTVAPRDSTLGGSSESESSNGSRLSRRF